MTSGFAAPSLVNHPVFAFWEGGKRKYYTTLVFAWKLTIPALFQGFVRVGGFRKPTEPYGFAHLRNRAIAGWQGPKFSQISETEDFLRHEMFDGRSARASREPFEIRVTAEAIIEVYGGCNTTRKVWEFRAKDALKDESTAWAISDKPAAWPDRGTLFAQSIHGAQAIFTYALFGAAAALVIWALLK